MIGKLTGQIDTRGEGWVIIDVGGVGYEVHCSTRTLGSLPAPGETATLAIETYVREDQIRLIGFSGDVERDWFRMLLSVQGVGTKVALAILGTLGADDLAAAIALEDKAGISRTPGVGPKVAQRIIAELRDRAASLAPDAIVASAGSGEEPAPRPHSDAVSALTNLGYPPSEASAAIAAAARNAGEEAGTAELIRLGLKELAR